MTMSWLCILGVMLYADYFEYTVGPKIFVLLFSNKYRGWANFEI